MSENPKDIRSKEFKAELDKFKALKVEEGSHWKFGFIPHPPKMITSAAEFGLRGSKEYRELTPYTLEYDQAALFPEWYFHFLKNFALFSPPHRNYCSKNREEFLELAIEEGSLKEQLLMKMEAEFDTAFRTKLGSSLREKYKTLSITREVVETQVVTELAGFASWTDTILRESNLAQSVVLRNEMGPYVSFLMAYDYSEQNIWRIIVGLLLKRCLRIKQKREFIEQADIVSLEKLPLLNRLERFLEIAQGEKLI